MPDDTNPTDPAAQTTSATPLANGAAGGVPVPPAVPDGTEIYDRIMADIDAELTTAGLTTLADKYANETSAEARARAKRYNEAFAEYERRFKQYGTEWLAQFTAYQHQALASIERANRAIEEEDNATLLSQIQQS